MAERIPVLLDTDPGNDIDDALAIAYLLKQPRCELLGITTVTGEVAKRAAIADVICRAAGRRHIPIHAGRSEVLLYGPGQPHAAQYEAIKDLPHRMDFPANEAVPFLRDQIRKRPGEVVLISIGPFSNLGILFALDPELPSMLRGLVSMAGAFFGHGNHEWNCVVDPIATAMVARTQRPSHVWHGLDVTTKCFQMADDVRSHYLGQPLATILPMADIWFRGADRIVYHDPLAVACAFEPSLCSYQSGTVVVDPADGKTTFLPGPGPDRVATSVDAERFFAHFFEITRG